MQKRARTVPSLNASCFVYLFIGLFTFQLKVYLENKKQTKINPEVFYCIVSESKRQAPHVTLMKNTSDQSLDTNQSKPCDLPFNLCPFWPSFSH